MAHIGRPYPWFQPTSTDADYFGSHQTPRACKWGLTGHYGVNDLASFQTDFLQTTMGGPGGWIRWDGSLVTTFTFPFTFEATWSFDATTKGNRLDWGIIDVFGNRMIAHTLLAVGFVHWNPGLNSFFPIYDVVEAPWNPDQILVGVPKPY